MKQWVPNQDDIAQREIDRVIRWPGQAISYKMGESEFFRLRDQTTGMDLRAFHAAVLRRGSVPFVVLESMLKDH